MEASKVLHQLKLSDVFGISRGVPQTYVPRPSVDEKFTQGLERQKHLIVYGASKQGKSCLHRHCLEPEARLLVQCGAGMAVHQIYARILRALGFSVHASSSPTFSGRPQANVSLKERNISMEIDPSDPVEVIELMQLVQLDRCVILEDFHYLPEETQIQVALDLKTFHDMSSLCFIIVGVWLESSKLLLKNEDLRGRVIGIDTDNWLVSELRQVVEKGERLLNISFSEPVISFLLDRCKRSVGNLQELCYRLCELLGQTRTSESTLEVHSVEQVRELLKSYIQI